MRYSFSRVGLIENVGCGPKTFDAMIFGREPIPRLNHGLRSFRFYQNRHLIHIELIRKRRNIVLPVPELPKAQPLRSGDWNDRASAAPKNPGIVSTRSLEFAGPKAVLVLLALSQIRADKPLFNYAVGFS